MAKTIPVRSIKICDLVSKGSIYLLVFLVPIFFLPWTINALDFNKQALMIVLTAVSLFAFMMKILVSERIRLNINAFYIPIGLLFVVLVFATFFSLWRYGSFWGWPLSPSESLISFICFFVIYLLIVNSFEKKEVSQLLILLVVSGSIAFLFAILQLFGKFILPWEFTKLNSFNTIGSINRVGIFAAVLLPLISMLLVLSGKRLWKLIFIFSLVLDILVLVIVNFSIVWWLAILGAALIMFLGRQKSDFFDNRWLFLPMVILTISLLFVFFKFQIPSMPNRLDEVFLTQESSLNIGWQVVKERPLLGSGPGTFIYDFSKYKEVSFNNTPLWNIRFDSASSKILNDLSTLGILGVISFLFLFGFFIFYGKFLIKENMPDKKVQKEAVDEAQIEKKSDKRFHWLISAGVFISALVLIFSYFIYYPGLTLNLTFFLLIASYISLVFPNKKEFILKSSSGLMLLVTFAFTLVFIFSLGILILEGQRYTAEAYYYNSLVKLQEKKIDEAVSKMESAARIVPQNDLYWRELSQMYLEKVNDVALNTDINQDEKNKRIQLLIMAAVNSSKMAADVNPNNVANWSVRGFVYQNLIGVVGGAKDWALRSYEEAERLEPTNPYFMVQSGIAVLKEAGFLSQDQKTERQKLLEEAKLQFEKGIDLKTDYAEGRFQLAMVYQALGKSGEAIAQIEEAKKADPYNPGLYFQSGMVYYQNKDYKEAKQEFEKAITIDPNYANALYFLGMIYDQEGNASSAIEKFRKVSELNPDNQNIKNIIENLKAGKRALEGISQEVPPKAPIEESPSETK